MRRRVFGASNTAVYYIIAIVVVVVAFFLLGGPAWLNGLSHGGRASGMGNLHWMQIIVSLAIGFFIGLMVSRRKW